MHPVSSKQCSVLRTANIRWRLGLCLAAVVGGTDVGVRVDDLMAAVATVGAVTPVPAVGGGNVGANFTIGDSAFGSVTVTSNTSINSTGSVVVGNGVVGFGTVSLNGFGADWSIINPGADITIGDEGTGAVTVTNQAQLVVADDSFLGASAGSSGKLTVTGPGSVHRNGDDIVVGVGGVGAADVLDGGRMIADVLTIADLAGSQGRVAVAGELSRVATSNLFVGDAGVGRLTVSQGGYVTSVAGQIGSLAGSVGSVDVSGAGSWWQLFNTLAVGNSGAGSLQVRQGGRVTTAAPVTVASLAVATGDLIVDGVDSRLSVDGALATGLGDGRITISNGAVVTTTALSTITPTGRATLAGGRWESTAAGNGAITVQGLLQGSGMIDAQGVTIGGGAQRGRLRTATGDHLHVTGLVVNNGLADLAGGELEIGGVLTNNGDIDTRNGATLRIGGAGLDNNSGAQLAISGGNVDVFGTVVNDSGAEIAVVGGATGVFHDNVTNNGRIFVSASSEIVMLENLTFVPSSVLGFQLATIEPTDAPHEAFGLIDVGSSSAITGRIEVQLAAGFSPVLGDTYEILRSSGGLTGTFSFEALPTLANGLALDVQYTANAVRLKVVSSIPGADFSGDGVVGGPDLAIWTNNFGRSAGATNAQGDANGDGDADGGDFLTWQQRMGGADAIAAVGAAPEPASLALLLCGAGWGMAARRR